VGFLSSERVVHSEGEGQAGPCQWTRSGEGWMPVAWTEGLEKPGDRPWVADI
jgi:hypothetical protein